MKFTSQVFLNNLLVPQFQRKGLEIKDDLSDINNPQGLLGARGGEMAGYGKPNDQ